MMVQAREEEGKSIVTRAVLRLVWPSILLQSARDRVATTTETVTASRLWSAMSVKQHK